MIMHTTATPAVGIQYAGGASDVNICKEAKGARSPSLRKFLTVA
jgi:hypothetical protein